jgi:hypothetical protein
MPTGEDNVVILVALIVSLLASTPSPAPSPSPAGATISVGRHGVRAATVIAPDGGITLIFPAGAFPAAGAQGIRILVDPVDPATITPPHGPQTLLGTIYRIRTIALPRGGAATPTASFEAVVRYPDPPGYLVESPALVYSVDGTSWTALKTEGVTELLQVQAPLSGVGYVAVVGRLVPLRLPKAAPERGADPVVIFALIAFAIGTAGVAAWMLRRKPGEDEEPELPA